jgi:hypothetical protein
VSAYSRDDGVPTVLAKSHSIVAPYELATATYVPAGTGTSAVPANDVPWNDNTSTCTPVLDTAVKWLTIPVVSGATLSLHSTLINRTSDDPAARIASTTPCFTVVVDAQTTLIVPPGVVGGGASVSVNKCPDDATDDDGAVPTAYSTMFDGVAATEPATGVAVRKGPDPPGVATGGPYTRPDVATVSSRSVVVVPVAEYGTTAPPAVPNGTPTAPNANFRPPNVID